MNIRDQIIAKKQELKTCTDETYKLSLLQDIEILMKHLGKTDKKIEKIKAKRQAAQKENQENLAELYLMQKYVLRMTKHIDHLIESTKLGEIERESTHYNRMKSRIKNLSDLLETYNEKFR